MGAPPSGEVGAEAPDWVALAASRLVLGFIGSRASGRLP